MKVVDITEYDYVQYFPDYGDIIKAGPHDYSDLCSDPSCPRQYPHGTETFHTERHHEIHNGE